MSNDLTRTYRPFTDSRPYTRWWWFYDDIKAEDVRTQLKWVRDRVSAAWRSPSCTPSPGQMKGPAG